MQLTGRVATWSRQKGYGYIDANDGHRYWAHFGEIATGTGEAFLQPGEEVSFTYGGAGEIQDGYRKAEDVRIDGQPERVWPTVSARDARIDIELTSRPE